MTTCTYVLVRSNVPKSMYGVQKISLRSWWSCCHVGHRDLIQISGYSGKNFFSWTHLAIPGPFWNIKTDSYAILCCPSSVGTMKSSSIFERQAIIWSLVFVVCRNVLIKKLIIIKTRHHGNNFLLRIHNWQAKILFGCIYLFPVLYWKNIKFFLYFVLHSSSMGTLVINMLQNQCNLIMP